MVTPSDKEYKLTKLIKQGKASIEIQFDPIAKWIDTTYGIKTLNIIYDTIGVYKETRPRLQIIFEFNDEAKKFRNEQHFGFDESKQQAIAKQFEIILKEQEINRPQKGWNLFSEKGESEYETKNILVVFSAFEGIAKTEANEGIPQDRIKEFIKEVDNKDIWEISRFSWGVTFFFYTDSQVEENSKNGMKEFLTDNYFKILKQYDEFNYFKRESFSGTLDSKEYFDTKFEGNWFYYYR
jgi:hypothetical protein